MFEATQSLGRGGFATTTKERNRFGISLPLIFAIGIYTLIITHARAVLQDPDTLWHIAIGRWIIAHGTLPDRGIFSGSMPNAPWVDTEWLAEIVMAWGYDHFGWSALVVGTALCEAVAIAILMRILLKRLTPAHAMIAATLGAALGFPHVIARPFILTIPILVVWVAALVRARSDNRAPSPWLALLIVLWANLHGSYLAGIGIAGLLAFEAVVLSEDWSTRIRAFRDWGYFGALAIAATMITPNGLESLLVPFRITSMNTLANIIEWRGTDFSLPSAIPLELWLLTVLFAALSLGWRLPPTRVGMALLLLAMALKHTRYCEYLGLVTPLLLAPSLARQFDRRKEIERIDRLMAEFATPANWRGMMIAAIALLTITFGALDRNLQPADAIFPAAAIAEVKANNIKGPVFNSYNFGGYLILSGIDPFVDGRAELYGDTFINRYGNAVTLVDDQLPELLKKYEVTWTILPPKSAAVTLMDHLPGWRRLYVDSLAVVHVRQPSS